jgi:hypothetical protein
MQDVGRRERSELRAAKPLVGNLPAGGDHPPPIRRWMPVVLALKVPRAGGFPKAPAPPPPAFIPLAKRFSAPAHSTREGQIVCGGSAGHS